MNPQEAMAFPDIAKIGVLADEYIEEEGYSEDEGIDDYKKGGYHPVYVGEVLNGRYVILQKLGWGHFSTVWLARDVKYDTYIAIKVQKSASHYLEAAFDEVEILQKAVKHANDEKWFEELKRFYNGKKLKFNRDDCHVVQLLNAFIYTGDYGRHFCMVFEILGVNLLEIIKRYDYKGIPLKICRKMAKQCLLGLHYLHKHCGIIHTDLKPENVLVCLDQEDLKRIYDNGMLAKEKEILIRMNGFKNQIRQMNGEPIVELDLSAEEAKEESREQSRKVSQIQLLTEEDIEREFNKQVKEKNIKNKKDLKNLRKKLKKKMKKNIKKMKEGKGSKKNSKVIEEPIEKKTEPRVVNGRHIDNGERGGLNFDFKIKIADLGNGCWVHHHFQPEIQTRQYRSPEVILGINYNETADTWSFACMLFELLTGEFLFDPKKDKNFRKSEDHLALMMELLNKFPTNYSTVGTNSKKYFDQYGNLKRIHSLHHMGLKELMMKFHGIVESEAEALASFLEPMLKIYPEERAKPGDMINHHWLDMETEDFFATKEDIEANPELYDKQYVDSSVFKRVVNDEEFDADCSFGEDEEESDDSGDESVNFYDKQCKVFDRSFKKVYVGYADGIDLNALDNTKNWQFDKKAKM